jgi:hypothetical protein
VIACTPVARFLVLVFLGACTTSPQHFGEERREPTAAAPPPEPAARSAAPPHEASATPSAAPPFEPSPAVTAERAFEVIFGASVEAPVERSARECLAHPDDVARIACMIELRFATDPAAKESALDLHRGGGIVAGVNPERDMDGGWRGKLRLVPELPVGPHRRHLAWIAAAHRDVEEFFAGLAFRAEAPIHYRWRALELRFFRSVGRTTPSAYAEGWAIAYNVSGSLHTSADAVRETWFHEVFHLNDRDHAGWSPRVLQPLFAAIVAGCNTGGRLSTPCLAPYSPGDTMVRGGTFYSFQPGNGVVEYAAELALRYYREHRAILAGRPLLKRPFKCGPEPNAEAWRLIAAEFFGGVDLVPPCP